LSSSSRSGPSLLRRYVKFAKRGVTCEDSTFEIYYDPLLFHKYFQSSCNLFSPYHAVSSLPPDAASMSPPLCRQTVAKKHDLRISVVSTAAIMCTARISRRANLRSKVRSKRRPTPDHHAFNVEESELGEKVLAHTRPDTVCRDEYSSHGGCSTSK
jgi:hypothetical protein